MQRHKYEEFSYVILDVLEQTRVIRVRLGPGPVLCQQCGRQYEPWDLPVLRYCEACGITLVGPALQVSYTTHTRIDPSHHDGSATPSRKPRAKKIKIRAFKVTRHEIIPVARDPWISLPPGAQLAKASWVRH